MTAGRDIVGIGELHTHLQVGRQPIGVEVLGRDVQVELLPQQLRKLPGQFALAEVQLRHQIAGGIGNRHQLPADLLGQCLEQRNDLLLQQPRHEPAQPPRVELAARLAGQQQRHTV